MNNKKLGSSFEQYLCEKLAAEGFWTHNFAQKKYGQPADIIAVRNRIAHLIDCKVCSKKGFNLNRIEENQELAMIRWHDTGNRTGYFAILIAEEIFMLDCYLTFRMRHEFSILNIDLIRKFGIRLENWIAKCE